MLRYLNVVNVILTPCVYQIESFCWTDSPLLFTRLTLFVVTLTLFLTRMTLLCLLDWLFLFTRFSLFVYQIDSFCWTDWYFLFTRLTIFVYQMPIRFRDGKGVPDLIEFTSAWMSLNVDLSSQTFSKNDRKLHRPIKTKRMLQTGYFCNWFSILKTLAKHTNVVTEMM